MLSYIIPLQNYLIDFFSFLKFLYLNLKKLVFLNPGIKKAVVEKADSVKAYTVGASGDMKEFTMTLGSLTDEEREIILKGCLINYNRR